MDWVSETLAESLFIPTPQAFGVAEFDSVESVFACLKMLNNLKIYDNTIMVKTATATSEAIDKWIAMKREEWISR